MRVGVSLPVRELRDDLEAIRDFAQAAEELGFTHLRVPDQVIRAKGGHLHEPLMLLSYVAAITKKIELVPSVIILPLRQTVLLAKQTAELDLLSSGRLRLGIGVGTDSLEYDRLGKDFANRGRRCDEQIDLLRALWTQPKINFDGKWEKVIDAGIDPLPKQRPIPLWIGAKAQPVESVLHRIATKADGLFVLCSPEEFPELWNSLETISKDNGAKKFKLGTETGVAVVGPREHEWRERVAGWKALGISHLCIRTLGGELETTQHVSKLREVSTDLEL